MYCQCHLDSLREKAFLCPRLLQSFDLAVLDAAVGMTHPILTIAPPFQSYRYRARWSHVHVAAFSFEEKDVVSEIDEVVSRDPNADQFPDVMLVQRVH